MTSKPIVTIVTIFGCFIAGYLTRQLQVFLDVAVINTYSGIVVVPISNVTPVLGKLALFIMHHILEYAIGAIIIASVTSKLGPNVCVAVAFWAGAILKPVINSVKVLIIYQDSVAVSAWIKSVLIQDLISSLVVLPAVVIATIILGRRRS